MACGKLTFAKLRKFVYAWDMPPFDLDECKRQLRAAKRNLNIAASHHDSKPSAVGVKVPIKGKFGRTNQQGITKTYVMREIEAVDHSSPSPEPTYEYLQWQRVMAAQQEVSEIVARKHIHMDFEARVRWIAGRAGVPYNTAKRFLR